MSNINGDLLDEGLQAVMGKERCQDVSSQFGKTEAKEIVTSPAAPHNDREKRTAKREPESVEDASWVKLNVISPMAKVKCCAKWAMLFGSISGLLFYWQQAGLLDPKAAVPSLIICALGAGLTVGYHAR